MTSADEHRARTRAFARVIGPFLALVPSIVAVRGPSLAPVVASFFESAALVWIGGAFLLIAGLVIIAHHQRWSGIAETLVSLFGWFLALRGVALLAAPSLIAYAAAEAVHAVRVMRASFGALAIAGVYLTYVGWLRDRQRAAARAQGIAVADNCRPEAEP